MAFLPRPVTRMMLAMPDATASSTPYWMIGLSTSGSISFGWALVAGRKRVPRPAAGKTGLRTARVTPESEERIWARRGYNGGAKVDPLYGRDHIEAVRSGLR